MALSGPTPTTCRSTKIRCCWLRMANAANANLAGDVNYHFVVNGDLIFAKKLSQCFDS
jgi:hypothetical protein